MRLDYLPAHLPVTARFKVWSLVLGLGRGKEAWGRDFAGPASCWTAPSPHPTYSFLKSSPWPPFGMSARCCKFWETGTGW